MRLLNARSQPTAKSHQLTIINREMTLEDCELYDRIGWNNYREEDLTETLLPALGDPIYFSERHSITDGIIVEIKKIRYLVQFQTDYDRSWDLARQQLTIIPTDLPLTESDCRKTGDRSGYYLQFFGQPVWVQSPVYPLDIRGNPCYHLLTIENKWGDSGNINILVGMDNDVPAEAYFEASCC